MSKKKVGLIVDDIVVSKRLFDLIQLSKESSVYEISCLIVQKTSQSGLRSLLKKVFDYINRHGCRKFFSAVTFKVILKIEAQFLKRTYSFKDFDTKYDLGKCDIESVIVNPQISRSGFVYRYNDEDLNKIKEKNLDILIRVGSGILRGDVLNICPRRIISFHYANNDINRGCPPGFWEVFYQQRSTGFIIQLLTDELDGGDVIYKGSIATSFLYSLNLARMNTKSPIFMHRVLEDLFSSNRDLLVYPKVPYSFPLYKIPNLFQQLHYIVKTINYVSKKVLRTLTSRRYRWGVAYQYCLNWREVTLWKSKVIKNPPNSFLANPFIIERNCSHYCFVEDFDYTRKKGVISVYKITKDGYTNLGIALREDFRLSYPFIIQSNNELYMCPTTHEAKDIRIYRCIDFPLVWEIEKILISNVSAANTNIFYMDEKWWLMTNIDSSILGDHGSELHVFHSKDLLTEPWISHPGNPVVFDSEQARNGGLLFEDNKIFRVFQVQGFDLYGENFGVARITRLDENHYTEDVEFTVKPEFLRKAKATHTYSFNKGLMAIGFAKIENYKK
ncbi:hypothetical protein SK355_02880 [Candidatus Fukatsuia symbiotica]|uniref:Glucosamine inositolphosphorylceramide transferase 1 N-terminal domain-containing protein n=1 Tax=Candidatus Fukatsuia symbiotica TaxID=1878942 RepID=A0A2U8I2P0_9GAMM|nr:hypothetical protein [Candidatus Fukatsuia symbiotica]AWK13386.1 hypothetical protein CCS41_00965 [Candidatus Fukatsuia symbiotica]MEA9444277.1 hypothetical protein [Candidatus Fukatsuia symbiotica]